MNKRISLACALLISGCFGLAPFFVPSKSALQKIISNVNELTSDVGKCRSEFSIPNNATDLKFKLLKIRRKGYLNPVSQHYEFPENGLGQLLPNRRVEFKSSFVGPGKLEYSAFGERGYAIRAGDPVTGKAIALSGFASPNFYFLVLFY